MKAMHKRGIRVLPGGDYGFAWAPHGENAKDLEYFVKYLGMTPMEAIVSGDASWGGQIMMKGKELGEIREGYLADLLLVDGDPLANIAILQDRQQLLAIMKDGVFHKEPEIALARAQPRSVAHDGRRDARCWTMVLGAACSACRSRRSSIWAVCGQRRACSSSRC